MVVDRLRTDLLNKLINARIDLAAYLQLRKAKGYMSVSESDTLRDNFFELNRELHDHALRQGLHLDQEEWNALRRAEGALAAAAVCLMSGHHDCPTFIAVNADKLENCLTTLTLSIQSLKAHSPLTKAGWLAALIPEEFGGSGLGLTEASIIMEEINRSGGNSGACHGQMYNMNTLLRHGSDKQKEFWLPRIATGEWRLQSMGVTEPTAGTDTTRIKTTAVKREDRYVINGQKVWISRVQHSDWMILLVRTTPLANVKRKSEGMSIFMVDIKEAMKNGMTVRPIPNMVNHETNELFFDNLEIPEENLIGEEGMGFHYILDGLNAERTLIAAECIGDGYWFMDRVTRYTCEREVFGRPIGQNQGVQFPIAEAFIAVEAANLMRFKACELFDQHLDCGAQANMAKYLAAKASWEAANACLQFHGGYGFACEYDIERKFRETRLYQVAPISTNLILSYIAEHVLEMPRSF
ncbi:biofilm formation regulator BssR [Salmonella enterica]|nr:biofilm formation regulator BssR [Salmonella enterica]